MFRQGDIIKNDSDKYFIVLSNDWVNDNSRDITVLPVNILSVKPPDKRRTHLVVQSRKHYEYFLVQCENISYLRDADFQYKKYDSLSWYELKRCRKRVIWMINRFENTEEYYATTGQAGD